MGQFDFNPFEEGGLPNEPDSTQNKQDPDLESKKKTVDLSKYQETDKQDPHSYEGLLSAISDMSNSHDFLDTLSECSDRMRYAEIKTVEQREHLESMFKKQWQRLDLSNLDEDKREQIIQKKDEVLHNIKELITSSENDREEADTERFSL